MKHRIYLLILPILFVLFLSSFKNYNLVKYAENDNKSIQNEANLSENNAIESELEAIYERFSALLPEGFLENINDMKGADGIKSVFDFIKSTLTGESNGTLKTLLRLVGIGLIFVLAEMFSADIGELSPSVRSAVSICLSVPVLLSVKDIIFEVQNGIDAGSDFFAGLIPVISSVLAVGTGTSTAAASAAGMGISLSFISAFLSKNLLPVSALIFAVSLVSNFECGQGLASVSKGIRGWFNFGIGLVSLILVATITFQGAISAAADTVTLRGVKYAASNMIPVVGSVISGAISTLASGVKLISSTVGAFSVVFLLSVMGAPLLTLLLYRFGIGTCITFCSLAGASFGQRFFEAVRGALDCIIGVLSCSLLIYILEIILFTVLAGRIL